MRKVVLRIIAFLIIIASFNACYHSGTTDQLMEIENYIEERPDSALAVLQCIDRSHLGRKADAAKYSLLYTMALDKNYIDTTDLSVIDPAIDYYSKHGSADEKLKAYYYQGVIHRNAGRTNDAAVSLHIAERYIEGSKDLKAVALLHSMNALIFRDTYNISKFMTHTQEAQKLYELIGDRRQVYICYYDLACGQMGLKNYHAADSLFALAESGLSGDSYMMGLLLSQQAELKIYEKTSAPSIAIGLLEKKRDVYNEPWTIKDYYLYACAKALCGDTSTCNSIIAALSDYNDSDGAYWLYRISRINGDNEGAINYLEKTVDRQDCALTEALSSTAMEAIKEFEVVDGLKRNQKTHTFILVTIISILVLILASILLMWAYKRKRDSVQEEIERRFQIAENMNNLLKEQGSDDQRSISLLRAAFINQYNGLTEFVRVFKDVSRTAVSEREIISLRTLLGKTCPNYISDSQAQTELMSLVDEYTDNIITNLKWEVPSLSERDRLFFCFLVLGLDATTVASILRFSVSNYYVKKNRIKQKIHDSKAPGIDRYIKYL